ANRGEVPFGRDAPLIVGIVTIDVDGQPARGQVAAGGVHAELARRLPGAEVLAERIVVEKDLATLVAEGNGDGLGRLVALATDVAAPDIGAVDHVGHRPRGQFVGAVAPLAGNPLQVIHG